MTCRLPAAILTLAIFVHVAVPGLIDTGRVLCISDGHMAEESASNTCCGDSEENPCSDCVDRPITETLDAAERTLPSELAMVVVELPLEAAANPWAEARPVPSAVDCLIDPPRSHLRTVILRL